MISFIEILRALAAILVANSHFKGVYPSDIFSFGGGFGLALFYMISGYLLVNIKGDTRLIPWYVKKLVRLYIPLWLFRIVGIVFRFTKIESFVYFIKCMIFPGNWFIASMVILYLIYFLLIKYAYIRYGKTVLQITIGVLSALFIILFITKPPIATFSLSWLTIEPVFAIETPYLITQLVWLSCMLIGASLREKPLTKMPPTESYKQWIYLFVWAFCVVIFLAIRLLTAQGMSVNIEIFLPVSYIGFAYCLFRLFMEQEEKCGKLMKTVPGKFIGVLSTCSLEMLYVQINLIHVLKDIGFPVNWILLVVSITIFAWLLHKVSNPICKLIVKKL